MQFGYKPCNSVSNLVFFVVVIVCFFQVVEEGNSICGGEYVPNPVCRIKCAQRLDSIEDSMKLD